MTCFHLRFVDPGEDIFRISYGLRLKLAPQPPFHRPFEIRLSGTMLVVTLKVDRADASSETHHGEWQSWGDASQKCHRGNGRLFRRPSTSEAKFTKQLLASVSSSTFSLSPPHRAIIFGVSDLTGSNGQLNTPKPLEPQPREWTTQHSHSS